MLVQKDGIFRNIDPGRLALFLQLGYTKVVGAQEKPKATTRAKPKGGGA